MAKKIGDDLANLIAGFRAKIERSVSRAEPLVVSPKLMSTFLDAVEERIKPSNSGLRGGMSVPPDFHGPKDDF
jgi:hypothetical protein